jgi:uncharacterized protein (TIGR02118 family)
MARLLAMYKTPKDPAAFDKYYFSTHVPLAKKIPGLKRYDVSKSVHAPGGKAPYYMIATLHFDSTEAIQKAFASPEGQATAADVPKFASGGVDLVFFDTKDV